MRTFERKMCRRFDSVVAVSSDDREHMCNEYGAESVFDVPTGVDTNFFRPCGNEPAEPHNIVFTGSMDWLPNEDAISYFTEQVMPRIKREIPDATLTVVGRNPYPSLLELLRDPDAKNRVPTYTGNSLPSGRELPSGRDKSGPYDSGNELPDGRDKSGPYRWR